MPPDPEVEKFAAITFPVALTLPLTLKSEITTPLKLKLPVFTVLLVTILPKALTSFTDTITFDVVVPVTFKSEITLPLRETLTANKLPVTLALAVIKSA